MVSALLIVGPVAVAACSAARPSTAPTAPTNVRPATTRAASPATSAHLRASPPTTAATKSKSPPVVTRPTSPSTTSQAPASKPLAGKIIAIDPGHNGGNGAAPGVINQTIWNGRENEACDTTGTETDSGYTEARFNFDVANYLVTELKAEGATVVLTRTSNSGVGPCITERAAIGNDAHADAAISIHADGGPPTGRGFAVLEPISDGINAAIIGASQVLGLDIRSALLAGAVEPVSSYDGINGIQPRDDLAGLNLSTVPKVLVECANMRNPTDAALLVTNAWQQRVAGALAAGLTAFLTQ